MTSVKLLLIAIVFTLGSVLVSAGDCRAIAWARGTWATAIKDMDFDSDSGLGMFYCRDDDKYYDSSPERKSDVQVMCNDQRWTFSMWNNDNSRIDFYHSGGGNYDMYWSGGNGNRIGRCWPSCRTRVQGLPYGAVSSDKALQCDVWWNQ